MAPVCAVCRFAPARDRIAISPEEARRLEEGWHYDKHGRYLCPRCSKYYGAGK
jgi:hypothetical protein